MDTIWFVGFVFIGLFVLLYVFFNKPIVIEGRVIEKSIARNDKDDSFVTVETPMKERILLKFDTHGVDILIQIGGESFHGRARELEKAIALNDTLRVESYDRCGVTRDVHKLLSVGRA